MLGLVCRLFMAVKAPYSFFIKVPGEAIFHASAPAIVVTLLYIQLALCAPVFDHPLHYILYGCQQIWVDWWIYAMVR